MPPVSASSVAAATNLRVLFSRLRTRLREVDTATDMTPSQTSVLIRLFKNGPASTSELAGAERVRSQSMTATLAALDRLGYLVRTPDPEDGRRQVITLTESGRRRAADSRQARQEWLATTMQQRYTEAERAVINEALTLLERITE
ncbi:MarR family transcriptional regulator [Mycolicibacterium canariasense]|uniref:MarR family transcriptional regulator n=1 Tax=Mycolicibacterium canariasense TaxID=228230 RepID=A0A117I8N7_MYCCR|nr:MarR family transcriptional regulator [Mycolicibacterium canariasense]MCV7211958.1 MarR family transcriptional regulator [Mycolicibacterium canariasense]ORU98105.1 MarR family transcriptional regulator [Mycolicibacterium canariasense]GAS93527.1 MarR family transcriptional regulator [Mycolicibacterium canariasense]